MIAVIRTEFTKLRRAQILLVGLLAMLLCPVMQYGSNLIVDDAYKVVYTFPHLFESTIWGNVQIFLPISLVMIGGWMLHREQQDETLKNVLTVPLTYRKLVLGKLCTVFLLAMLFGLLSCGFTLAFGFAVRLPGLTVPIALRGCLQLVACAGGVSLVVMPLILLFGHSAGGYLGGSILAFLLGYSILFFKGGFLFSFYPFLAVLHLIGFDLQDYNGGAQPANLGLCALSLAVMVVFTLLLVAFSAAPENGANPKKAKAKRGARRGARK